MSSFSSKLHGALINPLYKGILEFRRRGGFNIASTNPSAYYDRTNLATLFQDSAGTTPVTAAGQPVGLMLDKSQGLELGPELFSNFTYVSGGWVEGLDGVLTNDGLTGVTSDLAVSDLLEIGKSYRLTMTASVDTLYLSMWFGTDYLVSTIDFTSSFTQAITVNANNSQIYIRAESGRAATLSDISVREIAGNHQSQATTGKRPVTAGSPIYVDFDAVDDDLVATFPASIGAGCTVCRSLPGTGASITTGVTLTDTYTDNVDAHFLAIYTAAQWAALDAGQIANITKLLNQKAGL